MMTLGQALSNDLKQQSRATNDYQDGEETFKLRQNELNMVVPPD